VTTKKRPTKPTTQPKLTKSQEIELIAIRMFDTDRAKALKEIGPARKKFEAWKVKAHKELVAKLASAPPSEIMLRGWQENQEAVVEALASIPVPKAIRDAQDTINSHASYLLATDEEKKPLSDDVKSLSDWGYLCHTHKYAAQDYRAAAKQKYDRLQTEGLVKLAVTPKVKGFLDQVIKGEGPVVQYQLEG